MPIIDGFEETSADVFFQGSTAIKQRAVAEYQGRDHFLRCMQDNVVAPEIGHDL